LATVKSLFACCLTGLSRHLTLFWEDMMNKATTINAGLLLRSLMVTAVASLGLVACSSAPETSEATLSEGENTVSITAQATGKNLVLVGGGLKDDNAAVYQKIVALAGGTGVAKIGIITAASVPESQDPNRGTATASNAKANGLYYANLFKTTYGALDAQWIPIDLDQIANNSSQAVVNQLNGMTGFFFGGGDQSRLITCFYLSNHQNSPALSAILNRYAAGSVISGSSAGTAIMNAAPMVTGGESYNALRYGSFSSISASNPDDLSYDNLGGFGLFSYGLIDTHFSERGRQARIVRLASDRAKTMAYGVDENTALVVTNADTSTAKMEVLGQNGVFIFDLVGSTKGTGSSWSISNVKTSYLSSGDSYNPATKTATFASFKTALVGRERYASAKSPSRDIFSSPNNSCSTGRCKPREFVNIANDLFDSRSSQTSGQSYESGPIFEAKMVKSSTLGSAGYQGKQNNINFYSFKNLRLDFYKY
jgi:cyanophycinase